MRRKLTSVETNQAIWHVIFNENDSVAKSSRVEWVVRGKHQQQKTEMQRLQWGRTHVH